MADKLDGPFYSNRLSTGICRLLMLVLCCEKTVLLKPITLMLLNPNKSPPFYIWML